MFHRDRATGGPQTTSSHPVRRPGECLAAHPDGTVHSVEEDFKLHRGHGKVWLGALGIVMPGWLIWALAGFNCCRQTGQRNGLCVSLRLCPRLATFPPRLYPNRAMNRLRQVAVLTMLLLLGVAPAMACLVPGAAMTAGERACCRTMSTECGQPNMPVSHSCCRGTLPPTVSEKPVDATIATVHLSAVAIVPLAVWGMMATVFRVTCRLDYADFSLLGSPPTSVSILRI